MVVVSFARVKFLLQKAAVLSYHPLFPVDKICNHFTLRLTGDLPRSWHRQARDGKVRIPEAGLMEVVFGEEEEVDGVEAEAAVEVVEEAEQEEADVLFVETSNKEDAAGLVQNAPFPTIYRTRISTNLQSNPAKD